LRTDGRDDLADRLMLVDGPLRPVAAPHGVPDALRQRPTPPAVHRPTRAELVEQARSGDPAVVRAALTRLAEADGAADDSLAVLLEDLLRHPEPKVRRHAHRVSRHLLDRPTHLRHTALLLDDPQPELVRTAIRTLSHAGWAPAIATLVRLLTHPDAGVRRTATTGLARFGGPAVPALTHAAGRARPDRRRIYTDVLARLGRA
jgi:hypothetical protein